MNELRLKLLKDRWLEIQKLRDKQRKARAMIKKYQKQVREIAQKLPKLLDEFNNRMV